MILNFWTNMPRQTVQTPIRVYTVCHSICIVWTHYTIVEPHSSNVRVITTNILGVQIFRKFTVPLYIKGGYCNDKVLSKTNQTNMRAQGVHGQSPLSVRNPWTLWSLFMDMVLVCPPRPRVSLHVIKTVHWKCSGSPWKKSVESRESLDGCTDERSWYCKTPKNSDTRRITNYAPNFKEVDGAYWFRVLCPAVCQELCMLGFWNFI